jgi:uncharacterized protein (TIGR00299 family) protein
MTRIAIVEPAAGIAGDMMLGALLDLGVGEDWLRGLPAELGLEGVTVRMERVKRAEIACWKVDFDIPPQPHGRHLKHIRDIVDASRAPVAVKATANRAFELLTAAEAAVHGTTIERVHLHEVGAVDAILDVVGSIWGLELLGVRAVHCGIVSLGDGFVDAAHGTMAVPAPAVVRLIEGFDVRSGPEGSGELTTPTGAVLLQTLATRGIPAAYRPVKSGYGAGTKDFKGRANALRVVLADVDDAGVREQVALLTCDVDDMQGEYLAAAADAIRAAGALDVSLLSVLMKKGRPGTRIEVLCRPEDVQALEALLFTHTTTLGVRQSLVSRSVLPRVVKTVSVFGHDVAIKVASLPDGGSRMKPEFDDLVRVAAATGKTVPAVRDEAMRLA